MQNNCVLICLSQSVHLVNCFHYALLFPQRCCCSSVKKFSCSSVAFFCCYYILLFPRLCYFCHCFIPQVFPSFGISIFVFPLQLYYSVVPLTVQMTCCFQDSTITQCFFFHWFFHLFIFILFLLHLYYSVVSLNVLLFPWLVVFFCFHGYIFYHCATNPAATVVSTCMCIIFFRYCTLMCFLYCFYYNFNVLLFQWTVLLFCFPCCTLSFLWFPCCTVLFFPRLLSVFLLCFHCCFHFLFPIHMYYFLFP